jgi:iron-sulfur cluster repair protein YtfE (RIC family)
MSEDRLTAFGNQLVEVHVWLREMLADLRDDVADYLAGTADRPEEPADLRAHCLAFCSALHRHHRGEDSDAFPTLAARFPELAPVLAQLRADHRTVEGILTSVRALLDRLDPAMRQDAAAAQRIQSELAALTALLESHLTYEERQLVAALNRLDRPDWTARPPDFLRDDTSDVSSGWVPPFE